MPSALAPSRGARASGALRKSADKETEARATVHATTQPRTHTCRKGSLCGAGREPGSGFLWCLSVGVGLSLNGDPRCNLGQQPVKGEMAKTDPLAQPGGDSSNWLTRGQGMKRFQVNYG